MVCRHPTNHNVKNSCTELIQRDILFRAVEEDRMAEVTQYFQQAADLGLVEMVQLSGTGDEEGLKEFAEKADKEFVNGDVRERILYFERKTT